MQKPDTSIIDQAWPESELEHVNACPYCGSKERTLAYKDVQDLSFYCAPGTWTYWDCKSCEALYLSPRPTEKSIGKAYASYYTHQSVMLNSAQNFKTKLKQECLSHWFNMNIQPRFNLPKFLGFLLDPLKAYISIPFGLAQLANLPRGSLLDVGCGSGANLKIAAQLGWNVTGLEIDPAAVKVARSLGLNIIEGDYRKLAQITESFDCIVCSHVLEHVYNPLEMLTLITKLLRPGGLLLLSLPNAHSHVRYQFGADWRGLEAPRHISVPTLQEVVALLYQLGYVTILQTDVFNLTSPESNKIAKREATVRPMDFMFIKLKRIGGFSRFRGQSDFIQLEATR
jgi:2-polyprenyl-3-methyl-5-hydroxy-6-metoxy-1,4-benzoquinol methylase